MKKTESFALETKESIEYEKEHLKSHANEMIDSTDERKDSFPKRTFESYN